MKGFERKDPLFSLCGLNCGLCTMRLDGHCGGCGAGNQSCRIARCSLEHGGVEYCFQCGEYPCEKYADAGKYDSFITKQHQISDMEKAKRIGPAAYQAQQREKMDILQTLLERYNDGRHKTLYCVAVNLLETEDLKGVLQTIETATDRDTLNSKELARRTTQLLQELAEKENVVLKLRKRTGT